MRIYRAAAVTVAALALTFVSACKKDSTTSNNTGAITCTDSPICPSGTLTLGATVPSGAPTIVTTGSTNVSTGTSALVVAGTTSATANGYWLLVQDNVVRSWGVLAVSSGAFYGEVPLFCGAQRVYYAFTNGLGTSYYYLNATLTSCAGPSQFRVQLTWTSDPNSDLDLHLLRPAGLWESGNDCYYGNCTGGLTWGSSNPRLDVDDTEGFGPENIYLTSGAESGDYHIIIDDYDGTVGEVATVRIYFNDVEAAHYTSAAPGLDGSGRKYWDVAKVNILTRAITTVNTFSGTTPATFGAAPAWVPVAK